MLRLSSILVTLCASGGGAKYQSFNYRQNVDHFNAQCRKTFSQRFYIDDSHWTPGGPLFHILGGESPIGTKQLPNLYPFVSNVLAQSLHAMVLVTEHRYFGQSLPFGPNMSFSVSAGGCSGGMGLLNVEQALRDFIAVANFVKATQCLGCHVVAFGGSYPGLLATMVRVRYPDEVQAAVAASAPLGFLAGRVDPYGWFRTITEAAAASNPKCPAAVRRMFSAMQDARTADLIQEVGLCKDGLSDTAFRQEAISLARTQFATLAMTNYPPRVSDFAATCDRIVHEVFSSASGLGAARALLRPNMINETTSDKTCRSIRAEWPAGRSASIDCVDRTGCGAGRAGESWDYMGCTWLRIPIATNNVSDMFPPEGWSQDWLSDYCARRFDSVPTPDLLPSRFGFDDPSHLGAVASRIIFTNGLHDGWSVGGILAAVGKEMPALVMPNGAHHSEMNLPNENDTDDIIDARRAIDNYLRRWLASPSSVQSPAPGIVQYGRPPAEGRSPADPWAPNSISRIIMLSGFVFWIIALMKVIALITRRVSSSTERQMCHGVDRAALLDSNC